MAVQHVDITDPDLHEPKGVSTALIGQAYIADGAGSGTWSDFARTLLGAQGYAEANATATAVAAVDTALAVALGTTVAEVGATGFTVSTAGLITYTGDKTGYVQVTANFSAAPAALGVFKFTFAKNGTVLPASFTKVTYPNTTAKESSVSCVVSLAENDTLQLFVENKTDDGDITVTDISYQIIGA